MGWELIYSSFFLYSRRKKEEGRRKKEEAVIAMVSATKNVLSVLAVAISGIKLKNLIKFWPQTYYRNWEGKYRR